MNNVTYDKYSENYFKNKTIYKDIQKRECRI